MRSAGKYIFFFICTSLAGFIIYNKLPKPDPLEQRLAAYLPPKVKISKVDAIVLPDPSGDISFYHFAYSASGTCVDCSHACFLVQNDKVTPFYAKWLLTGDKPSFAGTGCEMLGEFSCQNFLGGTVFMYGVLKQFYLELTMNEHAEYLGCLTSDLKARVRLSNPR